MDVEGVFFKLVVTIDRFKQLFPTFLIGSLSGFSFVGPTECAVPYYAVAPTAWVGCFRRFNPSFARFAM
ncbi:hypothetical protein [Shewanella baltica]|uniref:hypothetical protein n=1 Tax=Shewanella baltica TaxID=62322 RepID=UPI0039B05725